MRTLLIAAISLGLGLVGTTGRGTEVGAQGPTEILTAPDGDPSTLGAGDPSAAPGLVTRGGVGSPGTYSGVDTAPSSATTPGETEVLPPPAEPAAAPAS